MKVFFIVLARDRRHVYEKIKELEALKFNYKIVCGEDLNHPNVVYQPAHGKYAAINFSMSLIPRDTDIVAMNDVDTKIHNFDVALKGFDNPKIGLVFGTELVRSGPQHLFFKLMNPIRRKLPIAGSGELLLIRRTVLEEVVPLKPCKAEDTLILFKVMEKNHEIFFCEDCYAETERTKTASKEEDYKRKTVTGIFQALSYSHPPISLRIFYILLPFASPLLLFAGENGYYWMRGILFGLKDFLRGDRTGIWKTNYLE